MSTLRNASKNRQRIHKERSQPAARAHLGRLEKKKDYKKRAERFHQFQNTVKALTKKALNRNPDEFYFHMINSRTEDGVHYEQPKGDEHTDEQIKLMQTQDLRYINFKRSTEHKKIDRLKSVHHLLDTKLRQPNRHTFFVDNKKKAQNFDVVQHLNTHPALIDRPFNRLTVDALQNQLINAPVDDCDLKKIAKERRREYKELSNRIEREKKLLVLAQKMEMKRNLMDKGVRPPKKIKPATVDSAPIYQWKMERKR